MVVWVLGKGWEAVCVPWGARHPQALEYVSTQPRCEPPLRL